MSERARAADTAPGAIAAPRKPPRWADLLPRALSGVAMVALALGTALLGGRAFALFWLLAALAIVWEWQSLVGRDGLPLRFGLGALALTLAVVSTLSGWPVLALPVVLAGAALVATVTPAGARTAAGFGLVYAGILVLPVLVLRASVPDGLQAILWLFAVVWGTDIMAYFGGRLVGGPKLWPRMSPSKTWSGFLIGIGAGALAGLAVAPDLSSRGAVFLMGLAAGAVAQGGDLFESAVKRRYGVKDTGRLIPGHGGAMDRLDGFIAAAAVAACFGAARAGLGAAGAGLFRW